MEELAQLPISVVPILENPKGDTLAEAISHLLDVYTGSTGYQFEHLDDPETVRWLWAQVETGAHCVDLSAPERVALLSRLSWVEGFEQFLHRTYIGQKRFSLEGTDMLVPMLDCALDSAAAAGGREVVIGMAHRGRLNVLTHVVGVPYLSIISDFEGRSGGQAKLTVPDMGTGDVKYHHGASGEYLTASDVPIQVVLAPNPSHLEFVDPVVEGMTRARQWTGEGRDDERDPNAVVPILVHGDAAFAAEGVVAETLNLARLEPYDTGGTIHIIVNNQVGFTTDPSDARSTRYASDLAKGYGVPVIHVNADDPEACLSAMTLAMDYRARYLDDIVVDLVGYRRYGHNEGDEPAYTQPIQYRKIEEHETVRVIWAARVEESGALDAEGISGMQDEIGTALRKIQDQAREAPIDEPDLSGADAPGPSALLFETGVETDVLGELNRIALQVPDDFEVHPKLRRQLDRRGVEFGSDFRLDWAHAEALAIGSIVHQGIPVRLTGQDSERGTFSQRHLVLHDHKTGQRVVPLRDAGPARLEVRNSPLTEVATVGFEYGYSVGAERDLVIWEAQFGDFVNVAQVIIDQFVAAGRSKWGQNSRLTLLLPHGYEGQGPEHSSARLERFLQLCAEDNLRVAYPTTPAQYFHLLRRQALAEAERPLVVMAPKSLLRHPGATSPVSELESGRFLSVLDDDEAASRALQITRLVLCSGKLHYDLIGYEERGEAGNTALARLEELYPFPAGALGALIAGYPDLREVIWAQEEPRNMGSLGFIGPRLRAVVPRRIPMHYVARPERASPAEGQARAHAAEQERLIREALFGKA
jgi:2-oxoglutarate dehydrogenase E1 component